MGNEQYHHIVKFNDRRLRYLSVGKRNTFFPPAGKPFDIRIGNRTVEMVINEYGRMKPRFEIWSTIRPLDEMCVGDTLIFTKTQGGVYELRRVATSKPR